MALAKRTYVDNDQTKPITAANLNAIQDEIIRNTSYAACTSAASTVEKAASIAGFTLASGAAVNIKFSYTNTATNPTLNISSTGAKPIMLYGTTRPGKTPDSSWKAGDIVRLVYDGSYWVMSGAASRSKLGLAESTRASSSAIATGDTIALGELLFEVTGTVS